MKRPVMFTGRLLPMLRGQIVVTPTRQGPWIADVPAADDAVVAMAMCRRSAEIELLGKLKAR